MLDPKNPQSTHGYEPEDWQNAKVQAKVYKLARYLGLDTSDKDALWVSETGKVWNYWKNQKV